MVYYIKSSIGKIYFKSHSLYSVILFNNHVSIQRNNILFLDENKFVQFCNICEWIYMKIILIDRIYYFYIDKNNNQYELLKIYNDKFYQL